MTILLTTGILGLTASSLAAILNNVHRASALVVTMAFRAFISALFESTGTCVLQRVLNAEAKRIMQPPGTQ